MKIILIRHGETHWNKLHRFQGRSDIPLNDTGLCQARLLSLVLKKECVAAIFSSPLQRALKTARIISALHDGVELFIDPGLQEMNLGDFEGMSPGSWAQKYPEFKEKWEKSPASLTMPGGESLSDVQQRAKRSLEKICKKYAPESTLLVCSHNFVISSLLCYASQQSLNTFRELRQDTAAISVLVKIGSSYSLKVVNDCSHLLDRD